MKIINASSKFIIVSLITLSFLVTGCGEVRPTEMIDHTNAADKPFFVGTYTYIPQLLGEISVNKALGILTLVADSLNSAVLQGDLDSKDFKALFHIFQNLRDYLEEQQSNSVEEKNRLISLLELMVDHEVGYTLENFISAVGTDVLTENIYPMLAYIMKMDTESVEGISMGEMEFNLSKQKFDELIYVLNGILDPEGNYKPVYDALEDLKNMPMKEGEGLTFGDMRSSINNFMAGVKNSDINMEAVLDTMSQLRKDEEYALNADMNNLLYSLGRLFSNNKNDIDGKHTDFDRILSSLKKLVAPDPQEREALKSFLGNALKGTIHLEGADALSGMIKGLATINPQHADEFDTAIYEYMFLRNIHGDLRYDPETGDVADIQVSLIRPMLYILDFLYVENMKWDLSSLISIPELPVERTDNPWQYVLGMVVNSLYEYPESYSYIADRTYPDPLEGMDWFWFEAHLTATIFKIPLPSIGSMEDLLDLVLNNSFFYTSMKQVFPPMEMLPIKDMLFGHTGREKTTGDKHKLIALVAPFLKYFYDIGRVEDVMHMATYFNEIDTSVRYIPMGEDNATLEQDGGFLNTLEGPYGRGLLYYALRGDSDDDNNGDVLDPIFDLMIRVLRKLDATDHDAGTLLDTFLSGSDEKEDKEKTDLIELLFDMDKNGECLLDKLYRILDDNHENLVVMFNSMGKILKAIPNDLLLSDDIMNTLLDEHFLETLKEQLSLLSDDENREAITSLIRSAAELFGVTDDDLLDAIDTMVDAIMLSSENIVDDMEMVLPILYDLLTTLVPDMEAEKANAGSIVDFLVAEMETENDLSRNARILGYKLLDIYDETYNEKGIITDNTPIMDAVDHYTGESGIYNVEPFIYFFRGLMSDNGELLWSLIGKEDSAGKSDKKADLLHKIFGENMEYMITGDFVKALFNSYDGKDPAALTLFEIIHLESPYGMPIHMHGLLGEIKTFIQNVTYYLEPDTEEYDVIFNLLDFLVETSTLKE